MTFIPSNNCRRCGSLSWTLSLELTSRMVYAVKDKGFGLVSYHAQDEEFNSKAVFTCECQPALRFNPYAKSCPKWLHAMFTDVRNHREPLNEENA